MEAGPSSGEWLKGLIRRESALQRVWSGPSKGKAQEGPYTIFLVQRVASLTWQSEQFRGRHLPGWERPPIFHFKQPSVWKSSRLLNTPGNFNRIPWWVYLHKKENSWSTSSHFPGFCAPALRVPETKHLLERSLAWIGGRDRLSDRHLSLWGVERANGRPSTTGHFTLRSWKTTELRIYSQNIFKFNEGSEDDVGRMSFPIRVQVPFSSLPKLLRGWSGAASERRTAGAATRRCESEGPTRELKISCP